MPLKNPDGSYSIERRLPGYGKQGLLRRTRLGTKKKAEATALEKAILEVYRRATYENPHLFAVLDAFQGRAPGRKGALSAQAILVALHEKSGLARLLARLNDPAWSEVTTDYMAYREEGLSRQEDYALNLLGRYIAPDTPFSAVCDGRFLQGVLERIERKEEILRGSVVRYHKRALSKILTWKLGRAERNRIFDSVHYAGEDDRRQLRESVVTAGAIGRLLRALDEARYQTGDEAASLLAAVAFTTGATIAPLSKTPRRLIRMVETPKGTFALIDLEGTKVLDRHGARDRTLVVPPVFAAGSYETPLGSRLAELLERPCGEDDPLFPIIYTRFYTLWKKARNRAGLMKAVRGDKPLRPHDSRRIHAMLAEQAGIERTAISQAGLGHHRMAQTDDYLQREVRYDFDDAIGIATVGRAEGSRRTGS